MALKGYDAISRDEIPNDKNNIPVTTNNSRIVLLVAALSACAAGLMLRQNLLAETQGGSDLAEAPSKFVVGSLPVDSGASAKTVGLFSSLLMARDSDRFLFGHQNDNFLGQYFRDDVGKAGHSDVMNATGSYPGLFGFDWLDVLENGLDFTEHVKFAYGEGAVIEFDWKPYNPETGGDSNDVSGKPCSKLRDGKKKEIDTYTGWMDIIAGDIRKFTDEDGDQIPIVFRLLHENTGAWYWWGTGDNDDDDPTCTNDDYVWLFNYTQSYFNDHHNLHNILWLYAPAKPSEHHSLAFHETPYGRYPGNDMVDLIGFDRYDTADDYSTSILEDCRAVANFSLNNGKISVIGETGVSDGIQNMTLDRYAEWFYDDFAAAILQDEMHLCSKVAFVLTWENAHPTKYWVPLPEDKTFPGLQKLHDTKMGIFADDDDWKRDIKHFGYH